MYPSRNFIHVQWILSPTMSSLIVVDCLAFVNLTSHSTKETSQEGDTSLDQLGESFDEQAPAEAADRLEIPPLEALDDRTPPLTNDNSMDFQLHEGEPPHGGESPVAAGLFDAHLEHADKDGDCVEEEPLANDEIADKEEDPHDHNETGNDGEAMEISAHDEASGKAGERTEGETREVPIEASKEDIVTLHDTSMELEMIADKKVTPTAPEKSTRPPSSPTLVSLAI